MFYCLYKGLRFFGCRIIFHAFTALLRFLSPPAYFPPFFCSIIEREDQDERCHVRRTRTELLQKKPSHASLSFEIDPKSGIDIKKKPPPPNTPSRCTPGGKKEEKKKQRNRGYSIPRRASTGETTGGVLCTFSFSMARLLLFLPPLYDSLVPLFCFRLRLRLLPTSRSRTCPFS